jgi:hypothetical protein
MFGRLHKLNLFYGPESLESNYMSVEAERVVYQLCAQIHGQKFRCLCVTLLFSIAASALLESHCLKKVKVCYKRVPPE